MNQKNDMVRFNVRLLRPKSREWVGEEVIVGVECFIIGKDDVSLG